MKKGIPIITKGVSGPKSSHSEIIRNPGSLEALADQIDTFDLHNAADGFIRANDFIEYASNNSTGLDSDKVLQAIEDGIRAGASLVIEAGGRPIQMVTANDAYGACRFYFIGSVKEVAERLKKLLDESK